MGIKVQLLTDITCIQRSAPCSLNVCNSDSQSVSLAFNLYMKFSLKVVRHLPKSSTSTTLYLYMHGCFYFLFPYAHRETFHYMAISLGVPVSDLLLTATTAISVHFDHPFFPSYKYMHVCVL